LVSSPKAKVLVLVDGRINGSAACCEDPDINGEMTATLLNSATTTCPLAEKGALSHG
jgi:hypothetical protein